MIPVYKLDDAELFYCSQEEWENYQEYRKTIKCKLEDAVLFCAKDPYHKEMVGYEGNCPKDHPDYLFCYDDNDKRLALNMIDAPDKKYFDDTMILHGINFIARHLNKGDDVIVVCNKGQSRSPAMCLMYMMAHGDFDYSKQWFEVFEDFYKIAPNWEPNQGIKDYCIDFWETIKQGVKQQNEEIY